ncbi:MAG TPA: alpha/beta fold hydrolase [Opitutaceae bacterium]
MTTFQLLARAALAAGAFVFAYAHAAKSPTPASAEPLSIEDLFRPRSFVRVQLSPDGQHIGATITDDSDAQHLLIINLNGEKPAALRADGNKDIASFRWLNDDRLAFTIADNKLYHGGVHLADRRDLRRYRPINTAYVRTIIGIPRARPGHLLVDIATTDDLVEINSTARPPAFGEPPSLNFARTYATPANVGRIVGWGTSVDDELALCLTHQGSRLRLHRYRAQSNSWHELPIDITKQPTFGMDPDNERLWIVDHDDNGYSLRPYACATGTLGEPVLRDATYDMAEGRLHFSRKSRKLVGISYPQRRLKNVWFQEPFAGIQQAIDGKHPNLDNRLIDFNDSETRFLYFSSGDREPGFFTLFDLTAKTSQLVTQVATWLNSQQLLPTQPLSFKARDGLKLEGYLTLPAGASKESPKPLVVLVHGGPTARDEWRFDPEVQFLASRGYAVLQPNYRGSSGYAPAISRQERLDFRRMHDDVTDATRAMIKTGVIDAKRVAIMGASFGGYLAMSGVAFEPELYRCAISNCGVFDWAALMKFRRKYYHPYAYDRMVQQYGDPREDRDRFEAASPLMHADDIRAPVLISHGKEDHVVNIEQSKKLVAALKKHGVPHETFFRSLEGHGFYNYDNRVEFYRTVEKFLARHLAAPAGGAAAASP